MLQIVKHCKEWNEIPKHERSSQSLIFKVKSGIERAEEKLKILENAI